VRVDAGGGEHPSGGQGDQNRDRHDRRCDHHPCTFFDTKNASGERDPEMHQTKKGKQWYFGLKAHVGVDAKEGTVHSVVTTAANVADSRVLPDLLHGEERKVWGDGGYQGQTEAFKEAAPKAQDMTCKRTRYKNRVDELQRAKNRTKSSVRAKVEHPFRILKRIFSFEGALSGVGQEPPPTVRLLRSRQPLPPPQTPGRTRAELRLTTPVDTSTGTQRPPTTPKPSQNSSSGPISTKLLTCTELP